MIFKFLIGITAASVFIITYAAFIMSSRQSRVEEAEELKKELLCQTITK